MALKLHHHDGLRSNSVQHASPRRFTVAEELFETWDSNTQLPPLKAATKRYSMRPQSPPRSRCHGRHSINHVSRQRTKLSTWNLPEDLPEENVQDLQEVQSPQPDDVQKFKMTKELKEDYERIVQKHVDGALCSRSAASLGTVISDDIKRRSKRENAPRHKLVVQTTVLDCKVVPCAMQASKCMWNVDTDNSCCVSYSTQRCHVFVNVYAVYHE